MNFKNPTLEKIFKRFKYTRNNTILLFETAKEKNILSYKVEGPSKFTFQDILFQFRCIVTTTDTYYRKMTNHSNKNYGVLIIDDRVIRKDDLTVEMIEEYLKQQPKDLQDLLARFDEKQTEEHVDELTTMSDHEHIHFGEFILMFRLAGVDLPDRIKKAWAL